MTTADPDEARLRGMRRSLLLARIGIVAWAIVLVVAIVLVFLSKPSWLWVLLAAFSALRLLMDARRLRTVLRALAEDEY